MLKIIFALYVLTTSLGLVAIKLGTTAGLPISFSEGKLHFNLAFYSLAGIFLYGTSFLLYMYLISKYDLNYIIPLATAFVYIAIYAASYLVFKESFTPVKILGITLISAGVILLSLKSS